MSAFPQTFQVIYAPKRKQERAKLACLRNVRTASFTTDFWAKPNGLDKGRTHKGSSTNLCANFLLGWWQVRTVLEFIVTWKPRRGK